MTRVSINLPKELINKFDEFLKEKKFNSRRKGLQDAMKEYINQYK